MSEEATEIVDESQTDTSTETDDAEVSAETDAPETSKEEPTDKSDAESEPALDAEPKKDSADQKKLAEKAYRGRESKRVRDLQGQNAKLMSILEQSVKPESDQAPKIEDFETLEDYNAASFKHLMAQEKAATQGENRGQASDPVFDQKKDDLFFEGSGKYEDFAEIVAGENVVMTPTMAEAIFEIDDMGTQVELTYALSKNVKEATRISRLSPIRQAAEIGKLEGKLSAPKTATRQPSKAPAPIKPVGGTKTTTDAHQLADDMKTFIKKRNRELGR